MAARIVTEVFPVMSGHIPPLRAFEAMTGSTPRNIAAGKMAYRLRKAIGGHWASSEGKVLTDTTANEDAVRDVLSDLWRTQGTTFADVRGARYDQNWKPNAKSFADFVAHGLMDDLRHELSARVPPRIDLRTIWAERLFDIDPWVISGRPAVSVSVSSRLVHKQDVLAYLRAHSGPEALIGLEVCDLTSTLKGEVESVVGPLREHRDRLLGFNPRGPMVEALTQAPDDQPVVHIVNGPREYDYPVGVLGLVVRSSDFRRFGVNSRLALSTLRIPPGLRWAMVKALSSLLIERGIIESNIETGSALGAALTRFTGLDTTMLRFGGGQSAPADSNVWGSLVRFGLFRRAPRFSQESMRVGVLDAVHSPLRNDFLTDVSGKLSSLQVGCTFEDIPFDGALSRSAIESAVDHYQDTKCDAMLALLPNTLDSEDEDDSGEWGSYRNLKHLTVGRGIPSQVVQDSTLEKKYAVANVVLGLLGKTGNIPFTLANKMNGVDLVVGLDIARERKTRLIGSMNATAIARIYMSDGEFLRYVVHDAPLEGETIPEGVLQSLFPKRDFENKRVIVHRDGYFRGGERNTLQAWGRNIGATFQLVEVIKSGTPRIYGFDGSGACMPQKGMMLRLSDREAFVVSSPPPGRDSTPRPVHLRTDGTLALDLAVESVLSLTLLHYGSVRPPKLPVTIHYSDKIAYFALKGIKPKELEGNVPFWL